MPAASLVYLIYTTLAIFRSIKCKVDTVIYRYNNSNTLTCFQMKLLLNLHAHPLQMPVKETKYNYGMLMDTFKSNFKPVKHLLFTNIDESHNKSMF